MLNNVDHILLTRFNLPSNGYESMVRAREGWLRNRVELFERYCLPSVRSQSDKRFKWIIYFDPLSPDWMKERITELNRDGLFIPVYRHEVLRGQLISDLKAAVGTPAGYLLTSNLDNDDGVASDFTARLRSVVPDGRTAAIYLLHGLIMSGGGVYRHTDPSNAFCSVLSPWPAPQTCWAEWHNQLERTMPVIRLDGPPAWLQVVHGSNVSNRVHGRRVSPTRFLDAFPGLLDELADPTLGQLLADRAALFPARMARDAGRKAAKTVVRTISGPEGIDEFKLRAAFLMRKVSKAMKGARNGSL
ncbi:hypothetical protein F8G81_23275 [Arthrobacter sp. CDRTa11]|uniref:glycosyltransferase n=1 Tax=Arthrobacter sp. CDRTa11 TaxID=2651199 RepID=UPI002265A8F3|nr:glycosyltransferase [Arthrobacter sp. CDRTa11]UZX05184.1 hypothetical protein F8G81_23275 [Arthrobacter sp. CDRTa11]